MKSYMEREVKIIEKQRKVMVEVLADPNFPQLNVLLREKIRLSLKQTQEVLL